MADYQKVNSGDDLEISAEAYNNWQTVAEAFQHYDLTGDGTNPLNDQASTIHIFNNSGDVCDRFRALAIDTAVVDPADNDVEFQNVITHNGIKPTATTSDRWGIVQTAIADQTFGRMVCVGVTVAWINLTATTDTQVDIANGSYTPVSGGSGLGTILWVLGGVTTATRIGEQWAVIRLGSASIPVGQYQYMVYQVVGNNQNGFDFVRAHPLI